MKNAFFLFLLCALAPLTTVSAAPVAAPTTVQTPISIMALAGYKPLSGAGLRVTLSDGDTTAFDPKTAPFIKGIVHDFDILNLVNELRGAGATGIAVNGVRLTNQSAIRAIGPTITIERHELKAPFVVEAIGNGALIQKLLQAKQSLLEQMRDSGIKTQIKVLSQLTLKAAPFPVGTTGK